MFAELPKIVGHDRITADPQVLEKFATCTLPDKRFGNIVIHPISEQEISQIVLIANKYKTPIYYFSTGKNWGYGTTQPVLENSITMILNKMNRICDYNAELGYVVIEPGVTQKQLFDFLQSKNAKHWMDCTDSSPYASVLGNALERGVGYTSYGDHFGHLCGLEYVLADGTISRTDTLQNEKSKTFHTYKWGTGPYLEGLFTQSNLGIVFRAGLWLMPAPKEHAYFIVQLSDENRFTDFIDRIRDLALNRITSNVHVFNPYMVSLGYEKFPVGKSPEQNLSEEELKNIYKKWNIHSWTALGGIYGTKAQVAACRLELKRTFGRWTRIDILTKKQLDILAKIRSLGKSKLSRRFLDTVLRLLLKKNLKQVELLPELFTFQRGEPGELLISKAYYKVQTELNWGRINPAQDGCGLFWLAPIVPAIGKEVESLLADLQKIYAAAESTPSISLIQVNPRTMIVAIFIVFDKTSEGDKKKARDLYFALTKYLRENNYQQYRTAVIYMDQLIEKKSGNGVITAKIKAALDPNHILAPGRYGP